MKFAYKYRGILYLGLMTIVLPWSAMHYALIPTIKTWIHNQRIQQKLAQTEPVNVSEETAPTLHNDILLNGELLSILQPITSDSKITISDYKPFTTQHIKGIEIHTATLTIDGNYKNILETIRYIEQHIPYCKISSLHFYSVNKPLQNILSLQATIYIEQPTQKQE